MDIVPDNKDIFDNFWCELSERWSQNYEMVFEDNNGHEQSINVCAACGADTEDFHTPMSEIAEAEGWDG